VKQGPALLFAGLAAWLLLRPREAQALQVDAASNDVSVVPDAAVTNLETNPIYNFVQIPLEVQAMTEPQANLSAFLFMIRSTEHVYPRDVLNDAAYSIFYGGSKFSNFADHPVLTGEKKGVPLPDHFCKAAGLKPGCVSTAAGAYQLIKGTWTRLRDRLNLPDFSPLSQDRAAVGLLEEIGAVDLIYAGDIEGAIKKASRIWASLPGSTAQQNPKALAYAMNRFDEGLAQG
jgi:muramidase (phage lysozyme)